MCTSAYPFGDKRRDVILYDCTVGAVAEQLADVQRVAGSIRKEQLFMSAANCLTDCKDPKSRYLYTTFSLPVSSTICFLALVPSSSKGQATITRAPLWARSVAMWRPIPAVPPVTITVLPSSLLLDIHIAFVVFW
ncbi:hypothetical protein SFRURICE_013202 [Spodoptera frugiperda]|nr:hypothetical protein SFRURICE_013202 [Spodoptera frugiperda]